MSSLHRALGCRLPLFSAAMAGAAGGQMAAEMVQAGGFGFVQAGNFTTKQLKEQLDLARKVTNTESRRLPCIGTGFQGWRHELLSDEEAIALLQLAIEETSAVWLAFGNHLEKWARLIREIGGNDVKLFILVSSVQDAIAAASWGADVLIVQGNEAGGHGMAAAQPLFSLFPLVSAQLRKQSSTSRPHLIAAGGIVHPSQVAAALALQDCAGVVLGTALLATSCSLYSDQQKAAIVNATQTGRRSMIWDRLRGTLGWPEGVDGRALENAWLREDVEGLSNEELQSRFKKAAEAKDPDRMLTWAGTSVGLVTAETSLAQVVRDIEEGAAAALQRANGLFSAGPSHL